MEHKTRTKALSWLLSLALALSLLPGLSLTALADGAKAFADFDVTTDTNKTKSGDDLTALQVTFNGKQWYVIKDDSTSATEGTLTLLYAGSLGNAKFDENGSNEYANSSIKTALGNMTATGIFKNVAEAIKYSGNGKLYLLSVDEANEVPLNVRKDFPSDAWWLRTPRGESNVAYVFVAATDTPGRIPNGGIDPTRSDVGVRPALQLDLSKVVFDSWSKTFIFCATTGATLIEGYGAGSVSVTVTAAAGHTLSYQWYKNTKDSNEGGEKIDDATSETYDIPTGKDEGTYYYYCVVTATYTDNSQTASVTSPVATVTVAADTDALVETLAADKGIDLSQYYLIPAEDMYFTPGQYWRTGNVNGRSVGGDNDYRVATKQFTKEKLPAGSLVFCKAYYVFETVAWGSDAGKLVTTGKRNNLLTTISNQFDWWDNYSFFGFNLTKYAEGDFSTKEKADQSTISNAFRIYVPKGEVGDVAKIGDDSYYTLADAVRAANSGDTVVLQRNATDNLVLTNGQNITLDLNGYTLTNDGHHSTIITQKGSTLEVVDTSKTNSGKVDNITHSFGPLCNNGGTVTLSGGTFIRSKEAGNGVNSYYTVVNRGTMTINAGVVIGDGEVEDSSLIDNGYSEINRSSYREIDPMVSYGYVESESAANPTLTINGGTFKGGRHTLKNDVNGIATIKNGDFSSSTGNAVYNVGKLTISGGTFTATAENKFALHSAAESGKTYGPASANGTTTVTGGALNGKLKKDEGATISVSGGKFKFDPTESNEGVTIADGKQMINVEGYYRYQVADKPITTAAVKVDQGDTTAEVDTSKITSVEDQAAATSVAQNTTADLEEAAAEHVKQIVAASETVTGSDKNIVIVPALEVTAEEYTVDGDNTTMTLDIEATYKSYETDNSITDATQIKNNTDADKVKEIGSGKLDTTGKAVEVEIEVPAAFATALGAGSANYKFNPIPVFVKHTHENRNFEYRAKLYHGDAPISPSIWEYFVAFTNPDGFSSFTISKTSSSVAEAVVNNETRYYVDLETALNDIPDGTTLTLTKSDMTNTELTAEINSAKKITIAKGTTNNVLSNLKITAGSGLNITTTYEDENSVTFQTTKQSSGGGSSSVATYSPTVSKAENGTVNVSPTAPKVGDKVTVTPKSNTGYEVDTVTVTDASGKTVSVTKNADGTYSFTQPSGKVKIDVTFKAMSTTTDALEGFTDTDASAWYADAVRWALDNGVMNGWANPLDAGMLFGPNDTTTRAMVATMLWRLEGSPVVSGEMKFVDVAEGTWYTEAVRWAASVGIISGSKIPAETTPWPMGFRSNDAVTREQLAAMLYRYAQYKKQGASADTDLSSYNDAQSVSGWATSAMQWAVGSSVINGTQKGTRAVVLDPQGSATRAQVATMLMRYSTAK